MYLGANITSVGKFNKVVELAVDVDDIDLFKILIKRHIPILRESAKEGEMFAKTAYNKGYVFSDDLIIKIINTKKIKEYLTTPYVATDEEWNKLNSGITYLNENKEEDLEIRNLQTLSHSFNVLMRVAYDRGMTEYCDEMEKIAVDHFVKVFEVLNRKYRSEEDGEISSDVKISKEGVISIGRNGIGCVTVVGKII